MSPVLLRHTASSFAVAAALCLSATACGSSGTDSSSTTTAPPVAATTTAGKAATPAGDSKTVSAADLCTFLEKNLPRWKSAGGELGAMTQVTTELFSFYDEKGQLVPRTELDEMTKANCPDARTEVLKTIGFDSFLEL